MRILALLFLVFGFSFSMFSQEVGEQMHNGKKCKVYVVKGGNTLYGLHTKYNVSIEEIVRNNPVVKEGLKVGQKIYIPIKELKEKENKKYTLYKVKKEETLYGISRKFNCTVKELIQLNPKVKDGLRSGQEIKIPTSKKELLKEAKPTDSTPTDSNPTIEYQITLEDSIIQHKVHKGETLYSLSRRYMVPVSKLRKVNELEDDKIKKGQVISIPLKQEHIKAIKVETISTEDSTSISKNKLVPSKEKYKIVLALPLKIASNSGVLSGIYTANTSLNGLTNISLEFLMGAQMALDSLEKLGLTATIEILDTKGDLEVLKKQLGDSNQNNYDIVIGPFYPKLLEYTAKWGKENKVPIIAVTKIPTHILENNPYVLSIVPSDLTLIGGMAKFLAKQHAKDRIIMIKAEDKEVKQKNLYFKERFQEALPEDSSHSIVTTSIGKSTGSTLRNVVNTNKKNIFICFSKDVKYVMHFINALNAVKNYSRTYADTKIIVVGLRELNSMNVFKSYYRNRFNFHFPATKYLNYDLPKVNQFVIDFRSKFGSDPSKFAFHGFDVVLSQCASLLLNLKRNNGLMDGFTMISLGENNGWENSNVFITKQDNFQLELLKIVSGAKPFNRK